jgi:hypothetical protein
MRTFLTLPAALCMTLSLPGMAAISAARSPCEAQTAIILERLQNEVVGELQADQRTAASAIVLEACQGREEAIEVEIDQAVSEAREEEQEKATSWLTESANKPGNARLKRKIP